MPTLLALESSCDETAVAILRSSHSAAPDILSNLITSQILLHRKYGGVVPELASRNHTTAIQPLIDAALAEAKLTIHEIEFFAATAGPGLAAALLIGHSYGKGLALATNKPFYGINHMEGHLLSPFIETADSIPPHLALVVSGGHTMLVDVQGHGNYSLIGKTRDDAAGEAFDKVGKMLGLPYPGGPEIEKMAQLGNPKAYNFPRTMLKDPHCDFSFSGLKTAVLYTVDKVKNLQKELPDLCASFQQAVIDSLIKKTLRAAELTGHNTVALSGGVSCNNALVNALKTACHKNRLTLATCPKKYSTDNAAMIAYAGYQAIRNDVTPSALTQEIHPNFPLTT